MLSRMMQGAVFRAKDALAAAFGPGELAAVPKLVDMLATHVPGVRREGEGRGRTRRYWFEWPSEQEVSLEQVWTVSIARTMLAVFREGEIGRVFNDLLTDYVRRCPSDAPTPE